MVTAMIRRYRFRGDAREFVGDLKAAIDEALDNAERKFGDKWDAMAHGASKSAKAARANAKKAQGAAKKAAAEAKKAAAALAAANGDNADELREAAAAATAAAEKAAAAATAAASTVEEAERLEKRAGVEPELPEESAA